MQPARCAMQTRLRSGALLHPGRGRGGEGRGTANINKQGSFCVSGQNAGAQQQQGERTRTSGKAEKKVKAVKTSKVTGKANSAANFSVGSSSSRQQHIINFNVARESPTAATTSAAASVANSSLNPGLGLGLGPRLLPLFMHNFNSNSLSTSPSITTRPLVTGTTLLLLSARLV